MACALLLSILMLVACTPKEEDTEDTPDATDATDATVSQEPEILIFTGEYINGESITEFITLGQYKGIEYDLVMVKIVTDEDVDEWIAYHMSQAEGITVEITERAVINGDSVIIDFEGFLDGIPFENGAAEKYPLDIGSNQFIPGFEEQIIGHFAGEEFDIEVVFPEIYQEPTLAGQPVVFKIKLHSIFAEEPPELTDEFVRDYLDVPSVAEYRAIVRAQLEIDNANEADNENKNQVWSVIVDGSVVNKYPEEEVEFRITRGMMQFTYYAAMYNLDINDFIAQISGLSLEEFIDTQITPGAMDDVKQDLILRAIAAQEGITITRAEFTAGVAKFVADFEYESEEAFLTLNGENAVWLALLSEKIIEFVMANSIIR